MIGQPQFEALLRTAVIAVRELTGAGWGRVGHGFLDDRFRIQASSDADQPACCVHDAPSPFPMSGLSWEEVSQSDSLRLTIPREAGEMTAGEPRSARAPLRSLLGARLFNAQGTADGLILVGDREDGCEFSEEDEALLCQLAVVTSLSLQHLEARAIAEGASRAKSDFLANMSHELRTPMNAILGMTELALSEELAPSVRDCLQTAKESADGLLDLLNEILDLSRIDAGRLQLESTQFSLRALIDRTIKPLGLRAYEKGLELACDVAKDVPDRLMGDPLRLRQVVTNLVANAVKFTSKGEVVMRTGVWSREGNRAVLEFTVSDTGIGILPEDQERIFAPFTQADASTTRRYGGTGLGLTISRHLVELMGGTLGVDSRLGAGSVFSFTVPFEVLPPLSEQPESDAAISARLAGLRALVIAENVTARHILEQVLAHWGMQPDCATDVPVGLTKIHQAVADGRPFAVVIADALMTGVDGFTLAGWIRGDPKLARGVVLMLSPADRKAKTARAQDVSAVFLEKPVSQADLLVAVLKALGGPMPQAESALRADLPPALPPPSRACAFCWPRTRRPIRSWPRGSWRNEGTLSNRPPTGPRPWSGSGSRTSTWCSWTFRCRSWTDSRRRLRFAPWRIRGRPTFRLLP